jgi:endoglucanase
VFTADWITLVSRFKNESAFVGADLRNEPHLITALTPNIYLTSGPMWGPFHGAFHPDRDWRYAAQTVGNHLLAINPRLLIIVEGVQAYLNPLTNVFSVGWWGSDLVGVKFAPITLSEPSQLVYSAHDYGPILYPAQWFNKHTSYGSLSNKWDHFWGYILNAPDGVRAPLFLGEFGTCNFAPYCIGFGRKYHKRQGLWFRSLVRYLHAHREISWAYFALNPLGPFKPSEDNFYSLMTRDWRHIHPVLLRGLAPLLPRKSLPTDCCAPLAF